MDSWEGSQLNVAKEILAYELTKLVHGEEEAEKAKETARQVFAQGGVSENMPSTALTAEQFRDGTITVADLLVAGGLAPSKGEAKRLIQQGGIMVNDAKVTDFGATLSQDAFADGVIVKKGKKIYHRFTVAE